MAESDSSYLSPSSEEPDSEASVDDNDSKSDGTWYEEEMGTVSKIDPEESPGVPHRSWLPCGYKKLDDNKNELIPRDHETEVIDAETGLIREIILLKKRSEDSAETPSEITSSILPDTVNSSPANDSVSRRAATGTKKRSTKVDSAKESTSTVTTAAGASLKDTDSEDGEKPAKKRARLVKIGELPPKEKNTKAPPSVTLKTAPSVAAKAAPTDAGLDTRDDDGKIHGARMRRTVGVKDPTIATYKTCIGGRPDSKSTGERPDNVKGSPAFHKCLKLYGEDHWMVAISGNRLAVMDELPTITDGSRNHFYSIEGQSCRAVALKVSNLVDFAQRWGSDLKGENIFGTSIEGDTANGPPVQRLPYEDPELDGSPAIWRGAETECNLTWSEYIKDALKFMSDHGVVVENTTNETVTRMKGLEGRTKEELQKNRKLTVEDTATCLSALYARCWAIRNNKHVVTSPLDDCNFVSGEWEKYIEYVPCIDEWLERKKREKSVVREVGERFGRVVAVRRRIIRSKNAVNSATAHDDYWDVKVGDMAPVRFKIQHMFHTYSVACSLIELVMGNAIDPLRRHYFGMSVTLHATMVRRSIKLDDNLVPTSKVVSGMATHLMKLKPRDLHPVEEKDAAPLSV